MAVSMTNGMGSDKDADYDSGISISGGQDDVEELERLIRERLKSDGDLAWKVGWSSLGGRGVIANTNIVSGEVIFTDIPVAIGPRGAAEGEAICVSCFRSRVHLKPCSEGCRLPVCSPSCQNSHSDSPECRTLLKLGVEEGDSWSPELYRALTPFRCLNLPKRDKEIIKMLQAHSSYELATEVKLLKRGLKSELSIADQNWIDFCCKVMNAVAFQAVTDDFESKQSSIRGLYPLAGLMNHSCTPNTRQVFDAEHRLKLIAVKPIAKGEEITTSYCPLLWATPIRISFLLKTKHFICKCSRCCDPTELGTFLAGLSCDCGGMVLPLNSQEPKSEWKCNSCLRSLSSGKALIMSSILSSHPGKSKNNLSLGQNNHMVLDNTLRFIISQRSHLKDMDESDLIERENKIKHILQIINQLQLGECRTKGLLLNELHSTLEEKLARNPNQINENNNGLLLKAKQILEGDVSIPKDILQNLGKIYRT